MPRSKNAFLDSSLSFIPFNFSIIATTSSTHSGDYEINSYSAGYLNTTSAVNAIRFRFSSGNIDDGIIKLYGVS